MSKSRESRQLLKVLLFTDLVDSTGLKQRLGDAEGAEIIARHNDVFRSSLSRFRGEEKGSAGDGFFALFEVPSDAVRCALAFQQDLANLNLAEPLQVRIGIHMGEIVELADRDRASEKGTLAGLAIDTAARVMGLAQGGQVLLTRHAFDSVRQQVKAAPDGSAIEWHAHGPYLFKGVDDPVEVCEVGIPGFSPLTPPPGSAKAQRAIAPGDDETLGWRPAVGLTVPERKGWVLEKKVGVGGFGEVWLARHNKTKDVRTFKFCYEADRLRSLKRELLTRA